MLPQDAKDVALVLDADPGEDAVEPDEVEAANVLRGELFEAALQERNVREPSFTREPSCVGDVPRIEVVRDQLGERMRRGEEVCREALATTELEPPERAVGARSIEAEHV